MANSRILASSLRRFLLKFVVAIIFFVAEVTHADFLRSWAVPLADPVTISADGFTAAHELTSNELVILGTKSNWSVESFVAIVRPDGTTKWQIALDQPAVVPGVPAGVSIVADPSDNPIISYSCPTFSGETCLTKFSAADGAVIWRATAENLPTGACRAQTADTAGYFLICQNGPIQRRDWDGNVLWQVIPSHSTRIALPLSNGNFVLSLYAIGVGTFEVLGRANGQSIWQGTVGGEVYGATGLASGGFLLHTQRSNGPSSYTSTLERFTDDGVLVWRNDFAAAGVSYSGEPLAVTNTVIVRYTVSQSYSRVRIATDFNGQFLWQAPADPISRVIVAYNGIYAWTNGAIHRLDLATGNDSLSVFVADTQAEIYGFKNSLLLSRDISEIVNGVFESRGAAIERYSPTMERTWRASLFSIEPQLVVQVQYPPNPQYVPRLCDRLRLQRNLPEFDLLLVRRDPTNSAGTQLRQRRQSDTGNLLGESSYARGAVCPASQIDGADLFALGLDSNLRRYKPDGTVVWSKVLDDASSIYGTFSIELSNGNIAVATSASSSGTWIFNAAGEQQTQRANLHAGLSGISAGIDGNFFLLLNDSSISHVSNQGVVSWNKRFGDITCFYDGYTGGIRDMVTARNGDLLLSYHTCQNEAHVVRVTAEGNVLWERALPVEIPYSYLRVAKLVESTSGSVYVTGCVARTGGTAYGSHTAIRALNESGAVEWSRNFDVFLGAQECATSIITANDLIYVSASTNDECRKSVLLRINRTGLLEYADAQSLANPHVVATEMGLTPRNSLIVAGDGYDAASLRRVTTVREVFPNGNTCDFDIDGDGSVRIPSDGTSILQEMFGFRSDGATSPSATCSLGPEISAVRAHSVVGTRPYSSQSNLAGDLDHDGTVNPLIDGLLLTRAQLGIPESRLTQGIRFPQSAVRTNSEAIAAYLRSCGVSVSQ